MSQNESDDPVLVLNIDLEKLIPNYYSISPFTGQKIDQAPSTYLK